MKTVISILFLLLSFLANAQWIQIDSPTSIELNDVCFPSEQIGYAVGGHYYEGNGIILKTINGGITWSIVDTAQTDYSFERVFFIDENIGFATGFSGLPGAISILYKTTDGGNSWELTELPMTTQILDIGTTSDYLYFISLSALFKSTDLGESWTMTSQIEQDFLDYVSFVDSEVGFGHIRQVTFAAMYKTYDAGVNWQKIEFSTNVLSSKQQAFVFVDSLMGFSGGWYNNHLMKTGDGGLTWEELNIDDGTMPLIEFITIKNSAIYAGGGGGLFFSNDLGATWTSQPLPASAGFSNAYGLNKVAIVDDSTAVGVGYEGGIIRTTNSGGTTGIEENYLKKRISIFPNPSSNLITVDLDESLSVRRMELLDVSGKVLKSYPTFKSQLDLSGLASGVYILKIQTDQGVVSKRVVME